jgi:ATP-dependent protease Clp ATPase subunit
VEPDLTEFVATSLQGAPKSINDMASLLLRELRGSALPAGPIGIISLEGIEQLAITDRDSASRKEAVQAAIARMADGKTLSMAFAGKLITFDSRRIFFVASANPNGLDKVVLTRLGHCGLGFHTSGALQPVHSMNGDALSHLTQDDLIQFGFTNSFLSAFAIRAQLNHLTEEDLQQICRLESPLLTPFTQAFGRSGVLLDFGQQALKQIAKAAADLGTGAQAITTILHHVLDDIAFEIVDTATPVQKVVVQSLHSRPEIVFGPLLINPSDYSPPPAAGDEITDQVRRLFPHGLPRRPARPRSGRSTARLANRNDLAPWLP